MAAESAPAPAWLRALRKPGWPFLNPGPEPRRLRFWRWAQRLAERKVQATWMDAYHHDRVCGGCHRPYSLMHEWPEVRPDLANAMNEHTTCPGCGATTTWECYGILPEILHVTPGLAEVPHG